MGKQPIDLDAKKLLTGNVTAIDAERRAMTVRDARGREHELSKDQPRDRHLRHGWVATVHGSQGATADRSMTHLESHRAMTVDAKTTYVAISRARHHAAIYTDNCEKLADAIEQRSGERQTALEGPPQYHVGGPQRANLSIQ